MQAPIAHTAVQCLTAIAQHHGLQVNPERLIADYALGAEEPSHLVMLRMAADIGFKSKLESMSWDGLLAQGGVFPLIAYTRVGTMVIVVGASLEGSKKIALLDPASPQAVVQLVDEQGFSDLCNGKVMLLER
jgi:ATP-binding cassette subfamily B protein